MSHLYLVESNLKIGYEEGQIVVRNLTTGDERRLPFAKVDGISVFGMPQLSTQLVRECISENVAIGYYTEDGHYIGGISPRDHVDPDRQRRQALLTEDADFCVTWAKRVVEAKIRNSLTLLESMRDEYDFNEEELHGLHHSLDSLVYAETVDMVNGFEGNAAKAYFQCLSKLVTREEFVFNGRSTQPPKDPFNSMISYGYSLLYRNIVGAIERHGLHTHFAFMHKIKRGHAALASDLIEDFRAPLVDRTVLDLVNSGQIDPEGFTPNDRGGFYMAKPTMKLLTDRLAGILTQRRKFFSAYDDRRSYGFQAMLDKKIVSVIEAIEKRDATRYTPFIWEIPAPDRQDFACSEDEDDDV